MNKKLLILIGLIIASIIAFIIIAYNANLPEQINEPVNEQEIEEETYPEEDALVLTNLGEFTITHYCICEKCCGKSDGITASGAVATPHRTVAVDPNIIPLGSVLLIDDYYYIAEDTGGSIKENRIDICVGSHEEALMLGVKKAEVFILEAK